MSDEEKTEQPPEQPPEEQDKKVVSLVTVKQADQEAFLEILEKWKEDVELGRVSALVIAGRVEGEDEFNIAGAQDAAYISVSKAQYRILKEDLCGDTDDEDEEDEPEE